MKTNISKENHYTIKADTDLKALIETIKEGELKKQKENAESAKPKPILGETKHNTNNKNTQKFLYEAEVRSWERHNSKKSITNNIFIKTQDKPAEELINFFATAISETKCTSFMAATWRIVTGDDVIPIINAAKNNPYFQGFKILKDNNTLLSKELLKYSKRNTEIDKFITTNKERIDKGWELSKVQKPLLSTEIWAKDKFIDSVFLPSVGSFLVMINKMEGFMQVPELAKLVSKNFFHIHGICKDWSNTVFKALAFMDLYSDIHINQNIFSKIIDGLTIKPHAASVIKDSAVPALTLTSEEDTTDTGLSGEGGSTTGDGIIS
jgi:hypothetical protein